ALDRETRGQEGFRELGLRDRHGLLLHSQGLSRDGLRRRHGRLHPGFGAGRWLVLPGLLSEQCHDYASLTASRPDRSAGGPAARPPEITNAPRGPPSPREAAPSVHGPRPAAKTSAPPPAASWGEGCPFIAQDPRACQASRRARSRPKSSLGGATRGS